MSKGDVIAVNSETGEPELMIGIDQKVPDFIRLDMGKNTILMSANNARILMDRLRYYAEIIDPS